jgi:diguanylate cyclase (GGDEF)-like protein
MLRKYLKDKGISLRTTQVVLVIGAVIISVFMFYSTYHLSVSFRRLTEASEEQIELRKAARELMDASDYLTERAQRFTIEGDLRFLNEYFTEAFQTNRREQALRTMSVKTDNSVAMESLQKAMDRSVSLMQMEYYAMRLVIEAKAYTNYPSQLRAVHLSNEDMELHPIEKMRRASEILLSDAYYTQKEHIRSNARHTLDELERMAYDTDAATLSSFSREMSFVRVIIMIQIIAVFAMLVLTTHLGIHPVLNAVERIKSGSPIPEVGANEFRYLARAYNKMYEVYKNSLSRLNFKASHDELTGVYNRAGYDLLLSSLDLSSTYMMMVDVDNFKEINDTYGHETGDNVLIKLARILKKNFRSDDYICRIGGDEFVIFMVHSNLGHRALVAGKMRRISEELADTSDGLPLVTISVGIVHGTEAPDVKTLFEKTDEAMYRSKHSGKHTFTFGS